MNYCSHCGTKLETGAAFCHNCGASVASTRFNSSNTSPVQGQKSRFIAGILAILLGTLGVHSFYLGFTRRGITQLLLFVFFLGWVSFIWGIVDAIRIFTANINCDANGITLSDNI